MINNTTVISATLLFLTVSLPFHATASTFDINFKGPGVSGALELTYGTATDSKYSQAFEVTGITGTFSDSNHGLNIVNAAVGPLVPIVHSTPEPTNLLAPNDFSRFPVGSGLSAMENGNLTYDNLFYPGGSPPTASDYPVHGGYLDIYGLMFDIGSGDVVDFWSNGGSGSISYGVAVATPSTALDYVSGGVSVTPEPSTMALLSGGLLGIFAWRRRVAGLRVN